MQLSSSAIASMGFKPLPPGTSLSAAFHALHVFSAQGFTLGDEPISRQRGKVAGIEYEIAVGQSLNAICNSLFGHSFSDDEDEWAKTHNAGPPYVTVHLGPTPIHTVTAGLTKNEEGNLRSYDTFPEARDELRQLAARILPSVEMAFAVAFEGTTPPVQIVPVDAVTFGITTDNIVVQDFRITGSASAYVSRRIAPDQLQSCLKSVSENAETISTRVARFFQLARRDDDDLKRFLYYFLAIEIEIHRAFKTVSKSAHLARAAAFDPRTAAAVKQLLEAKQENWTNLADLFVWCVSSVWTHLTAADIDEFRKLKRIRDDIAHGKAAAPPPSSVPAVEKLATKLHVRPSTSL